MFSKIIIYYLKKWYFIGLLKNETQKKAYELHSSFYFIFIPGWHQVPVSLIKQKGMVAKDTLAKMKQLI